MVTRGRALGTCHVLVVPQVDEEAAWAERRMSGEEKGWTGPEDRIRLCRRAAASSDEVSPAGGPPLYHVTSSARSWTRRYPSKPPLRRLHRSSSVFIRLLPSSSILRPKFSQPVNHVACWSPTGLLSFKVQSIHFYLYSPKSHLQMCQRAGTDSGEEERWNQRGGQSQQNDSSERISDVKVLHGSLTGLTHPTSWVQV